ncbi:MAG: hypothetical protein V3U75_10950 [Methylococcaceae bacterium]
MNNKRLVFIGHNRKDAAIIRRIGSFIDAGVEVTAFTFRRDGEPETPGPDWNNVDLGYAEHAKLFQRIFLLLKAIRTIARNRQYFKDADVIYARNLDMYMLALAGKVLSGGKRQKLIYECLDVHMAMTKQNYKGAALRWIERYVLKRSDLLVISSPGFLREYFKPTQAYNGPYMLVENKLYFKNTRVDRPETNQFSANGSEPLVIVWVGILRCQKTLDLFIALAKSEGSAVAIRFSGQISEFLIPDFEDQIRPYSNIIFEGAYLWPEGLEKAYRGAHLVWSQELSWKGFNSDWLIPNRVYEGSYFGVLSLCVEGTETANIVKERALGYVLSEATEQALIEFFRAVDRSELHDKQRALLDRPLTDFTASPDDAAQIIQKVFGEDVAIDSTLVNYDEA